MPSNTALAAVVVPLVLGVLGLAGSVWVARIQRSARKNEERLRFYEGYDHTYNNLLKDYDRVVREKAEGLERERVLVGDVHRVRGERDAALRRCTALDRENERLLESMEGRNAQAGPDGG